MTDRKPHILIVEARFYDDIADMLVEGAVAELEASGATWERIEVPGAFEIPATINWALASYDGFVTLGCVIRGETTHYDYVCGESARGLQELALHKQAPIGYGILTTENREQAVVRADPKQKNKGKDAAEACLRMVEIKRRFTGA
jgi:6,7-dimethyl-8-ribityllumazine synthase